jgi:hypothetical protein
MRARSSAGVCTALLFLTACASGSSAPSVGNSPQPTPTPKPTSTVIAAGSQCRQALGGTVTFEDAKHGVVLRVTTAKPKVTNHAFASYAHSPANGHFLSVDLNVRNVGDNGFRLDPTDFVFTTSSGRRLTVDSGQAPYSGASHVLAPTFLVSGAGEHGPLIYDTAQVHGTIVFKVSGKTACSWTV